VRDLHSSFLEKGALVQDNFCNGRPLQLFTSPFENEGIEGDLLAYKVARDPENLPLPFFAKEGCSELIRLKHWQPINLVEL
jgi:hypothetical protein